MALVDDHEIVRDGVRAVLSAEPDVEVVAEAATGGDAVSRVALTAPDVAIVDINLPDANGVEVCREIRDRCPTTKVLILTSYGDDEALFDAIIAGAAGYVLKHVRGAELVRCVRRVATGEQLLDPVAAQRMRERAAAREDESNYASLTEQERRVLALLAEGLTNREVAQRLYLSEKTVKNYVSNVLMKLGLTRRTEAAAYSARRDARRRVIHTSVAGTRAVRY